MLHKDICIQFTLGGQPFEAVGFLEAGEEFVSGEEALRRTDNGQLISTKKDWEFVDRHREELSEEFEERWLATAMQDPVSPGYVWCLDRDTDPDNGPWMHLTDCWDQDVLVLRRRVLS